MNTNWKELECLIVNWQALPWLQMKNCRFFRENPWVHHHTQNRSNIGAHYYLTLSRSDISFIINKVCQFRTCTTTMQWVAAKIILRYLNQYSKIGLKICRSWSLHVSAFSNIDWTNSLDDTISMGGFAIFLGEIWSHAVVQSKLLYQD